MNAPPLLIATALTKRYSASREAPAVVDRLDLNIASGEIVVVIGRSGSGKSTLLNLIGQMDAPDSGRICFAGSDCSGWDDEQRTTFRRRNLGFVFQAYNLLPTLSVWENVAMSLELNGELDDKRVEKILGRLGLGQLAGRYPDQLSGGEQQRTAVARALIHNPQLIIADEPTGNLDQRTGAQVVNEFESCVREAGAALLMASHSPDMIGRADRVLELESGALRDTSA